jgi:hypothetical protein
VDAEQCIALNTAARDYFYVLEVINKLKYSTGGVLRAVGDSVAGQRRQGKGGFRHGARGAISLLAGAGAIGCSRLWPWFLA